MLVPFASVDAILAYADDEGNIHTSISGYTQLLLRRSSADTPSAKRATARMASRRRGTPASRGQHPPRPQLRACGVLTPRCMAALGPSAAWSCSILLVERLQLSSRVTAMQARLQQLEEKLAAAQVKVNTNILASKACLPRYFCLYFCKLLLRSSCARSRAYRATCVCGDLPSLLFPPSKADKVCMCTLTPPHPLPPRSFHPLPCHT